MEADDNRAVSALFRVFGTSDQAPKADRVEPTRHRGMHRGELIFLATLVPITLLVAVGNELVRWLGWGVGLLLTIPASFIALNLLAVISAGKNSTRKWQRVLLLFVIWGYARYQVGGVVSLLAWIWFLLAALNGLAAGLLLLGKSVRLGLQQPNLSASKPFHGTGLMIWRGSLLLIAHLGIIVAGFWIGWRWVMVAGAILDLGCLGVVLNPSSQWLGQVIRRRSREGILITIDDGPDPKDTPRILDLLDTYQAKAIFFMIGEKVRRHPELAREVLRRGHEIGNHTMTHPQATFWCAGPWRTRREIVACQKLIEETTGFTPKWFRAPVGHRNWFTHPVAAALGLQVMGWTRRGFDAIGNDASKVLERIIPDLTDRDIVLVHEATPIAEEVMEGLLRALANQHHGLSDPESGPSEKVCDS
ncbi:polysaccharide deacetylase family protein [Luteolibacter pohnpeiensis]|uniref:Polysaccharide deacetylase family protein n=1 Tax=Luteolibacter pohnpeiensis TaxID=454153 RepID=A0A934S9M6_9BACT|nr:polysaccharide deacetylase family protein [Luteolibacter pohnpeiensis]MBK1883426.1 polysaccharide deacetylase family protein [Luteolibacter pohnpeiensis]